MDDLVTQLTAAWLTEVLHAHGHLATSHVLQIHRVRPVDFLHSWHVYFTAQYASAAVPPVPQQLFLKLAKPHAVAAAQREATFYARLAPQLGVLPLVPCGGTGPPSRSAIRTILPRTFSPRRQTLLEELLFELGQIASRVLPKAALRSPAFRRCCQLLPPFLPRRAIPQAYGGPNCKHHCRTAASVTLIPRSAKSSATWR
jgi:hypothetical protein